MTRTMLLPPAPRCTLGARPAAKTAAVDGPQTARERPPIVPARAEDELARLRSQGVVAGARGDPTPLLTTASFTRLQTPVVDDYALGWTVLTRDWGGGTVLTHSGSNTMWFVTTWLAPEKDALIIAATNAANDEAALAVDEAFGPMIDRFFYP